MLWVPSRELLVLTTDGNLTEIGSVLGLDENKRGCHGRVEERGVSMWSVFVGSGRQKDFSRGQRLGQTRGNTLVALIIHASLRPRPYSSMCHSRCSSSTFLCILVITSCYTGFRVRSSLLPSRDCSNLQPHPQSTAHSFKTLDNHKIRTPSTGWLGGASHLGVQMKKPRYGFLSYLSATNLASRGPVSRKSPEVG